MKKHKIEIALDEFPPELHDIFADADVYDSSCHSGARVLYSGQGYYVKIDEAGKLKREAELTRMFSQMGMGAELVAYVSGVHDYMVTREVVGEDATHWLERPEQLCEILAAVMKKLHNRPVELVPPSPCMEVYRELDHGSKLKMDTLIHGDFCLPNIILDGGKFQAFLDVGLAGVGDRHIDIYWAVWSLQYNLKTDRYNDYFLELYGRANFDPEVLKAVAEIEAQL